MHMNYSIRALNTSESKLLLQLLPLASICLPSDTSCLCCGSQCLASPPGCLSPGGLALLCHLMYPGLTFWLEFCVLALPHQIGKDGAISWAARRTRRG